jgi:hypothetical protein
VQDKRRAVLEWLLADKEYAYSDMRQEELRNKRAKNSGTWFLNAIEFRNWEEGRAPSLLFCPGIRTQLYQESADNSWVRKIRNRVSDPIQLLLIE